MVEKKKRNNKSITILLIIFVIICLTYLIRYLFFKVDSELAKYQEIENSFNVKGVIIRKESVVTLPQNTKIKYTIDEGEKVGYGKKIVEVIKGSHIDDNLSAKLSELNTRIIQIKTSNTDNNFFEQDKQKINDSIANKAIEIKKIAKSGNYLNLDQTKTELTRYLYKKSLIEGNDSFFGKNIEELEKQKAELDKIYKNNIETIYAQISGIVSYELDGMENVLSPEKIKSIGIKEINDITEKLSKDKTNEKEKLSGVKVVDNTEWYVACAVDKSSLDGLKKGSKIGLRFKNMGNGNVNENVDAYVYDISNTEGDSSVVAIKINHNIDEFYKHRYVEFDIIKNQFKGVLVPTKSLVEKEGLDGVYIIKSGIVRFVPVKILFSDNSNTLVTNLENDQTVAVDAGTYKIKQYDEVIITTKRVKENQYIVNH